MGNQKQRILSMGVQEKADWLSLVEEHGLDGLNDRAMEDIFILGHIKGFMAGIRWTLDRTTKKEEV